MLNADIRYPPQDWTKSTWRSLTDFLRRCDSLEPPASEQVESRPSGQPVTLGELLGLWDAPGAPRDVARILAALQKQTEAASACRQGGGCQEGKELACVACTGACREAHRSTATPPRIGMLGASQPSRHAW